MNQGCFVQFAGISEYARFFGQVRLQFTLKTAHLQKVNGKLFH